MEQKILGKITDIHFAYGHKKVLCGIDMSVYEGQQILLVGANGCGKSTFLNILAGILKPEKGLIELDEGNGLERLSGNRLSGFSGYVPQNSPLIPELSVKDNLLLWYGDNQTLQQEMQHGLLQRLHLDTLLKLRAGTLSGGMARRVSIACALAGNPKLLILDEPGAALDLECKLALQNCLKEYRRNGGTVIFSSHDTLDLKEADVVYALKEGKIETIDKNLRGIELWDAISNN